MFFVINRLEVFRLVMRRDGRGGGDGGERGLRGLRLLQQARQRYLRAIQRGGETRQSKIVRA